MLSDGTPDHALPRGGHCTDDGPGMTSCINRVPNELLVRILSEAVDYADYADSVRDALISLASVCRHWRDVVVGSPALWREARFRFRVEREPGDLYARMLHIFDQRSKSTITHATIENVCYKSAYEDQVAILARSLATLSDLEVNMRYLRVENSPSEDARATPRSKQAERRAQTAAIDQSGAQPRSPGF